MYLAIGVMIAVLLHNYLLGRRTVGLRFGLLCDSSFHPSLKVTVRYKAFIFRLRPGWQLLLCFHASTSLSMTDVLANTEMITFSF